MRARLVALVSAVVGLLAMPLAASAAEPPAAAGRFIVTLHDSSDSRSVAAEYRRAGADIDFVYTAALNGFAGAMSESDLGRLRADGRVARIERDGIATVSTTQEVATWGLDRVDQRDLPLSGIYTYNRTGAGVTAYIVDTGIRLDHAEFKTESASRAVAGYNAFAGSADDCNGHGTHVAGTVGGTTYGMAKDVTLVAVRVLDCAGSGSWSGVIDGLEWVIGNHVAGVPAVANMSLGGGAISSVDDAVRATIADGVTVAVAAGNSNRDACAYSPARTPEALTVGATTSTDARASYSNYGKCLDVFAPGSSITSAWHLDGQTTHTISGTSMATPHAAGAAALILEGTSPASPMTPGQVATRLLGQAVASKVTSAGTGSPNLLLQADLAPLTHVAPTATIAFWECAGAKCTFTGSGTASLTWNFGNGTTAPGAADTPANVTYTAAGTYTVTLTARDQYGWTGISDAKTVSCTATGNGRKRTLSCTAS